MTYAEAIRHAVQSIINADLTGPATRAAVMAIIPEEHHTTHYQPGASS